MVGRGPGPTVTGSFIQAECDTCRKPGSSALIKLRNPHLAADPQTRQPRLPSVHRRFADAPTWGGAGRLATSAVRGGTGGRAAAAVRGHPAAGQYAVVGAD